MWRGREREKTKKRLKKPRPPREILRFGTKLPNFKMLFVTGCYNQIVEGAVANLEWSAKKKKKGGLCGSVCMLREVMRPD